MRDPGPGRGGDVYRNDDPAPGHGRAVRASRRNSGDSRNENHVGHYCNRVSLRTFGCRHRSPHRTMFRTLCGFLSFCRHNSLNRSSDRSRLSTRCGKKRRLPRTCRPDFAYGQVDPVPSHRYTSNFRQSAFRFAADREHEATMDRPIVGIGQNRRNPCSSDTGDGRFVNKAKEVFRRVRKCGDGNDRAGERGENRRQRVLFDSVRQGVPDAPARLGFCLRFRRFRRYGDRNIAIAVASQPSRR